MKIKEVPAQETLGLRLEILRPNSTLKDCVFPGDNDPFSKHFGAFQNNRIVAVVSVYKRSHSKFPGIGFQIRAMATHPDARGNGIGRKLLKIAEDYAFQSGANYIWANARVSAINFYRKSEYNIEENEFIIEGIGPHMLISKLANITSYSATKSQKK